MIKELLEDFQIRPDLFHFIGPPLKTQLEAWVRNCGYSVPDDLLQLWSETGGGEIFESETILAPFTTRNLGDDVDSVNAFHQRRGMPPDNLIFHVGIGGLSVVSKGSGRYASLSEETYEERRQFSSLSDWYLSLVHAEYAARYGLGERNA
jgi:hypothetical protein